MIKLVSNTGVGFQLLTATEHNPLCTSQKTSFHLKQNGTWLFNAARAQMTLNKQKKLGVLPHQMN
jgi:hypothetical protein